MIKKNFEYIILSLVLVVLIQGFLKAPEGISEEEELYRIKIHDLNQDKKNDLFIINELTNKNNIYENFYDSLKNDNSINDATVNELKSALSNYANSRR